MGHSRKGLTEYVMRTQKPLLISDKFEDWVRAHSDEVEVFAHMKTECWLGAPMIVAGTIIGVIGLQNFERPGVFTERHVGLLQTIANQAAIAIDNDRQYDRKILDLQAVSNFQTAISGLDNIDTEIKQVYEIAKTTLAGRMVTKNMYIALLDEMANTVSFPLLIRNGKMIPESEKVGRHPFAPRPWGERKGLTEYVIRTEHPLLIPRKFDQWIAEHADEVVAFDLKTKCWLGAPMIVSGNTIGVIGLQDYDREDVFDEGHKELLQIVANQAAVAISNSQLVEKARRNRLAKLQEISELMTRAGSNPGQVLEMIGQAANEATEADFSSIYLFDDNTQKFTGGVRVFQSDQEDQPEHIQKLDGADFPQHGGTVWEVASKQEAQFINSSDRVGIHTDIAIQYSVKAFAALPLMVEANDTVTNTVGVLVINYQSEHPFSDDDKEILKHLGNQAAVAISYADAHASAQANEQLAALGGAAAALQHRLGNHINVTLPAVMRLRFRIGNDPVAEQILETIERNTLFANEVIRRMQMPLRPDEYVPTSINALVREAIKTCVQETVRFSQATLRSMPFSQASDPDGDTSGTPAIHVLDNLSEGIPMTVAGTMRMSEVFRVLIENAIKAVYPESGTVTVSTALRSDSRRDHVVIRVSDTGKGIEEDVKQRLFKQPVPRREFGEGAGLGLWLSNIIVRSHQGRIDLEWSEVGKGSTFVVDLPILTKAPAVSSSIVRDGGND